MSDHDAPINIFLGSSTDCYYPNISVHRVVKKINMQFKGELRLSFFVAMMAGYLSERPKVVTVAKRPF